MNPEQQKSAMEFAHGGRTPSPGLEGNNRDDLSEMAEDDEAKKKKKGLCRKFLKFCFSHIGLCGMVVAYSVAGGFIFEHLEKTNEKQECVKKMEKYYPFENDTVTKLWQIAENFRDDEYMDMAIAEYSKLLKKYSQTILDLDYDGKNCTEMGQVEGNDYSWSFAGSLLFSVTVITTIGYGNIAPKTFWGRLVCIAYATLGIPLMLLCLANIGDVMADIFRFVYSKICCCGCCRRKEKPRKDEDAINDGSDSSVGRDTPTAWQNRYANQNPAAPGQQVLESGAVVMDDDTEEDEEEEERISVPLTITMLVIGGYVFMGALLFGVWEGWTALEAAYFCFVTISTIGFGDLVPGSAGFANSIDKYKMILSSVYMMFGMAILSMCFSLIQEEIVAKFQWLGEKLGIVDKEKPVEEEEEEEEDQDALEEGMEDGQKPSDMPGVHHGPPDTSDKKKLY